MGKRKKRKKVHNENNGNTANELKNNIDWNFIEKECIDKSEDVDHTLEIRFGDKN